MGKKSDIVHADRLKLYRTPSEHSICRQEDENDEEEETTPVEQAQEPPKKAQKPIPEAEDLIEQLQNFLRPSKQKSKKKPVPDKPLPPPPPQQPCKSIAKHRRRKHSQEYLVHDEDKDPRTGTWLKPNEIPQVTLNKYLMSQQTYPSTGVKARAVPVVNFITTTLAKKEAPSPLLRVAVALTTVMGICATNNNQTTIQTIIGNQPDLGTLYDCMTVKRFDGVYALPDPLKCIDTSKLDEIHSFEAEILQHKPEVTPILIFRCILTMVSLICNENALWMATLKTKAWELPITPEKCRLYAQYNHYDGIPLGLDKPKFVLKVDPKDPRTRISPMKKKRHCNYNSYTHYDEEILQIREYDARLEGDDIHVLQDLTGTACIYSHLACIPEEQPNSTITWDPPYSWEKEKNHNFQVYHPMGRFAVKHVDNYFLIPNLGIGGAAIKMEGGNILMDTGYIISNASESAFYSPDPLKNSSRGAMENFLDIQSALLNFSKNYVKSTTSNVQRDLGEGQLVRKIAHD